MTTLTPRDALEVLGRALGNIGDEGYNVTHASLALTVLTNLVERAGEPVAYRWLRNGEPVAGYWHDTPVTDRELKAAKDCEELATWTVQYAYALTPTAPGASHE